MCILVENILFSWNSERKKRTPCVCVCVRMEHELKILVSSLRGVLVTMPTVYHGFCRKPTEGENHSYLKKARKTQMNNRAREQSYLFI